MNEQELWSSFKKNSSLDLDIKKIIMVAYTNLVHYVIHNSKFFPSHVVDEKDFFQFGVEGLSEAIDRFDPGYGTKFETYAIQRIRGKIIDEIRKTQIKPRVLNSETGIQYTNISLESCEVNKIAHSDNCDKLCLVEIIPSGSKNPDEIIQKKEQKEVLIKMIKSLDERDRLIISLYYYENLNYKRIADILSITVSRVSQIHSKIIKEMKEKLQTYFNS